LASLGRSKDAGQLETSHLQVASSRLVVYCIFFLPIFLKVDVEILLPRVGVDIVGDTI
jgi:hypothetical protein